MEERSLGSLIIEGLEQAIAYERGEGPGRVVVLDARDAVVNMPPTYDAGRVREVRRRLALSQQVFADALNVSSDTVKAWEQGTRTPSGAAMRLLEIAETAPDVLLAHVHAPTLTPVTMQED